MTETRDGARGASREIVVWWFRGRPSSSDGQARSLLKALESYCDLRVHAAPLVGVGRAWRSGLRGRYPVELPDPDILIGVGRESHWSMLAARWVRGGRIITFSKPFLPRWFFDLCIIPEHMGARSSSRVVATRGVLSTPSEPRSREAGTGIIIIGGPAPQYRWSDDEIIAQITEIIARHPQHRWFLTTTMQTLAETERCMQALSAANVFCIPHYEADPTWMYSRIKDVEQVWISEDSLALIYQSLTDGAATGILPVPRRKSRPNREIAALEGTAVFFPAWQAGAPMHAPQSPFNEAARCAAEIYKRWLQSAG